jgi:uncharacterized protein (TIGR00730 family)
LHLSTIQSICVYCGSSPGRDPIYMDAGRRLGRSLAESGVRLVYGGGTKGIMGAVAAGAISAGGKVTGIIPRFLVNKEATESELHRLDETVITGDMHQRKHAMFGRSDAFVALPGGIGTVEEIVEIMTWAQLGRHRKPMVFANIAGFWDPFLALIDHMSTEGFVHTAHLVKPIVVHQPEEVVPAILQAAAVRPPGEGVERIIEKL